SSMSYMDSKDYSSFNKKEVSIGPFDVVGKYLNKTENMRLSFSDKLDLYYSDFSIVPLFVQENYIDNRPAGCESSLEVFDRLSMAADLISEADIVDSKLRGSQQWGLMPLHAALSSVGPAFHVSGGHDGMYRFPGWLGQNSKSSKLSRMLRDVQTHMRLRVSADKTEIRKSYIPALVPELISPLAIQGAGGISDVVSLMDHYYLTKDHFDAMVELHLDGERMYKEVPAAVKSAFTREYNKLNHPVAFQTVANAAASKAASAPASLKPDMEDVIDDDDDAAVAVNDEGDEEDEEEDQSSDGLDKDVLIKMPAKAKAGLASRAESNGSSSSTRGRGRGRGAKAASATSQPRKKRKTADSAPGVFQLTNFVPTRVRTLTTILSRLDRQTPTVSTIDMYSPGAIAGVCASIFGLAAVTLAIFFAMRNRRHRLANSSPSKYLPLLIACLCVLGGTRSGSTFTNALVAMAADAVCEAVPALVVDETQPLLSESAIRTRYASNPNEFARSYIDRPQHSSYASPRSLAVSPAVLPYSPVENVVVVAPSDMSDSEDSGIESCTSIRSDEQDAVQLEAAADEPGANDPQPADCGTAVDTLEPTLEHTPFTFSQPVDAIDDDGVPSVEQNCLTGSNETAASSTPSQRVFSEPLASIDTRLVPHASMAADSEGRLRSSSLNARARVFVPSGRSRTMADTSNRGDNESRDAAVPITI
ncbi:DNA replication factor C complex subunit Rfc1, partial [Coemansia sp. RSA 2531]